jgi:hypothetical protein
VPWVRALDDLLTSENRNSAADQRVVEVFLRLLPAAGERFESGIVQTVTPEEVVAGIGTRSYAATMDEAERATLLDRVRSLLAAHPDTRGRAQLELPYVTVAHRLVPR